MSSTAVVSFQKEAPQRGPGTPVRSGALAGSGAGRQWLFLLLTPVLALVLAAGLAEAALRVFCRNSLYLPEDEKKLMYRYDAMLGWFPVAGSKHTFTGYRTIHVEHNHLGFRGPDYAPSRKPGIIFLGDSFVWGFDVEAQERFTEKLQARHPEWSIYNFGVSGYGTDQEYLLLQQHMATFKPRVVFLVFCTDNDDGDNAFNVRHGGYYKPYCTFNGDDLKFNGIPVPRSERVFYAEHPLLAHSYVARLAARTWFSRSAPPDRRNPTPTVAIIKDLQRYVERHNARFAIGLQRGYPRLEEALRDLQVPYVDLTNSFCYPTHGGHWTPQGQLVVADKIERFLLDGGFLEPAASTASNEPPSD